MVMRSRYVVPMTVIGGLFLLISPFLFHYPPFGWGVWALITALFLYGMKNFRGDLLRLEREQRELAVAQSGGEPQSGSEAASRRNAAKQTGKAPFDFSEILSAKESARDGSGLSGAVVMLGLIGTFYGLMVVIASAAPAVQQQSNSYDVGMVLQPIFSGMRGIFGTSLCGLVAALVLNLAKSLHRTTQLEFMAGIEEYTRLLLLPSLEENGAQSGDQLLDEIRGMSRKFDRLREAFVESASKVSGEVALAAQRIDGSTQLLIKEMDRSTGTLTNALDQASVRSAQEVRSAVDESRIAMTAAADRAADRSEKTAQQISETVRRSAEELKEAIEVTELRASEQSVKALTEALDGSMSSLIKEMDRSTGTLTNALDQASGRSAQEVRSAVDESRIAMTAAIDGSTQSLIKEADRSADTLTSAMDRAADRSETTAQQISETVHRSAGELKEAIEVTELLASEKFVKALTEALTTAAEVRTAEPSAAPIGTVGGGLVEAVALMKANQIEFQAGLEMFSKGVEELLEGLHRNQEDESAQADYFERLEAALTAFSDRAAETLVESSLHTQEILLEVLRQVNPQERSVSGGES